MIAPYAALVLSSLTPAALHAPIVRQDVAPGWIWLDATGATPEVVFRRSFEFGHAPEGALLAGTCDNHMTVLLNGKVVGEHGAWEEVLALEVGKSIVPGTNLIEVRARNDGGPAGLAMRLTINGRQRVVTDARWECATPEGALAGQWQRPVVIGAVGSDEVVWTSQIDLSDFGGRGSVASTPQRARAAEELHLLDGFEAELLYNVPRAKEGSWVALTEDHRGRLYASDQGGKGLFRITPAALDEPDAVTVVEPVNVPVSGAQGMCWAFDALYVNVNGQGLWRIRDTDGDDQLDEATNLIPLGNGGEHGPHAVRKTQDGKGLYFIGGNHTMPPPFEGSKAPANWGEDLLLPRQWDARGHARGRLAPGGWIARCDPNGENIEIVSSGYRNQYDIAIDPRGEMFTYDADMEWDLGSPWYRPTRVCHVTSGSEFGWRSGTGKWPTYYEDSLPPVLEIGPGSPTGIEFGTGARFPAKYQHALFILDWTFGTIYAVHLEPRGSSFRATKEDFVWSKPLAVTDAVVADDGALYFTVGGRGSASALYRVVYRGSESTEPVAALEPTETERARARRHALEQFHGRVDPLAVDAAWPFLSSEDRHLRFAARIAIENQPVATWRERAMALTDPRALTTAMVALARQGDDLDRAVVVTTLGGQSLGGFPEPVLLAALRAYAIAFARRAEPDEVLRFVAMNNLKGLFPARSERVNTELAELLTYLGSETVVATTMALMAAEGEPELPPWAELIQRNDTYGGPIAKMLDDMPPQQKIRYALILRNAKAGWTPELRKAYFSFFPEASQHPGGASYGGFLENIRSEAAELLSVAERRSLASLLGESLVTAPPKDVRPPVGPGRTWTVDAAVEVLAAPLRHQSFEAGKNLYHATSCSSCHRFDGEGGAIGPDLTTVANKFSVRDLLEAMVEPSAVISDQYGAHMVRDTDGNIAEGILVEDGDEVRIYPRDPAADPIVLDRSEIDVIVESKTSQMPTGLVDGLNEAELRDLVAYLLSGGNPQADAFKKGAR